MQDHLGRLDYPTLLEGIGDQMPGVRDDPPTPDALGCEDRRVRVAG